MPSILDQLIADDQKFLDRYRRRYLASLCAEMGIGVDLPDMALREAVAMIELARELGFPRR